MTNDASSQTSCLPFSKPYVRGIPKRFPKAFEIISNCAGQMENVSEILWVIYNAIWDINALFDAVFLFQSNTCKEPSHL
jgi:hypothetical protein